MKLEKLLEGQEYELVQGSLDVEIDRIDFDSRLIKDKSLFVCMTRMGFDGHDYAQNAVDAGAAALLVEYNLEGIDKNTTIVKVKDARKMTAYLSCALYGFPSNKMRVIGVTGTNGKTTTTYLVEAVLKSIGHKTGVIGTIENRIIDKVIPSKNTTPYASEFQEMLSKMVDAGVEDVIMEVTAHGLTFNRVDYTDFDIGLFTNLTQDHLDYYETMENYRNSKLELFKMTKFNIFNADDEASKYYIANTDKDYCTYGIENDADFRAKNIVISHTGVDYVLVYKNNEYKIHYRTPGNFGAYNSLAAIAICIKLGIDLDKIIKVLADYTGVPGRFQTVVSEKGFSVVVDYAHTPDGLENVLKTAKEFTKGKLITVFGCGGDRDKTKRPIMAGIAADYSDMVYITSDNPRTENPDSILDDVEVGIKNRSVKYIKEVNREKAIIAAINEAKENDVIIIAGKGHEDYQIIGTTKNHFSDIEKVMENIKIAK